MNAMPVAVIDRCASGSLAGTLSFAQVVGELAAVGIESYHADYRGGDTSYYLADGRTYSVELPGHGADVAESFDGDAIVAAIRGSQRGEIRYPEFVQLSMRAGCVGYMVWIAGRQVTYFGRRGEQHIERFPD